jgi:hypothetical protein
MNVQDLKAGQKVQYIGKTRHDIKEGALITIREVQVDLEPGNSLVYVESSMTPVSPTDLIA